jgi:hypothetical protein
MTKEGADIAMDHYFHQISRPGGDGTRRERTSPQTGSPPLSEDKSEERRTS